MVSALSQGVPALCTGWSHKYKELFQAYGFPEGILLVNDRLEVVYSKIDMLISDDQRERVKEKIIDAAKLQKQEVLCMWDDIFSIINKI